MPEPFSKIKWWEGHLKVGRCHVEYSKKTRQNKLSTSKQKKLQMFHQFTMDFTLRKKAAGSKVGRVTENPSMELSPKQVDPQRISGCASDKFMKYFVNDCVLKSTLFRIALSSFRSLACWWWIHWFISKVLLTCYNLPTHISWSNP